MSAILHFLNQLNEGKDLIYIVFRIVIIYIYAIALVRFSIRFHLRTTFDFVLFVMIGAILGSGVFGSTSLLITLFLSMVLVLTHKFFAWLAYRSYPLGRVIKGRDYILFANKRFNRKLMFALQITEDEVLEECRKQLQCESLASVAEVRLERTGNISFTRQT